MSSNKSGTLVDTAGTDTVCSELELMSDKYMYAVSLVSLI